MASAFTFIIHNEFLSHLKKIDETNIPWPIDVQCVTFDTITRIHSFLNKHGVYVPHRQYSMFYHHIYNPRVTLDSKFGLLRYTLDNHFTTEEYREEFLSIFCKFQQIYRGFCKLAFVYKRRCAKKQVCMDLCLNDLDISSKNVVSLLINKHIYLYSLTDVVNMFQSALSHMNYMVSCPVSVKDPYTNTPFSVSILYTLYFFMKARLCNVPILIHGFFKCDFNLRMFSMLYDNFIQDFAIVNYVNTTPYICLLDGLCSMIYDYTSTDDTVNIHPKFPERMLYDIMKPYLTLYYKSKYSRTRELNIHYGRVVRKKLHEFFVFNPKFGTVDRTDSSGQLIFNHRHITYKDHRLSGDLFTYSTAHVDDSDHEENVYSETIGEYRNYRARRASYSMSLSEDSYSSEEDSV